MSSTTEDQGQSWGPNPVGRRHDADKVEKRGFCTSTVKKLPWIFMGSTRPPNRVRKVTASPGHSWASFSPGLSAPLLSSLHSRSPAEASALPPGVFITASPARSHSLTPRPLCLLGHSFTLVSAFSTFLPVFLPPFLCPPTTPPLCFSPTGFALSVPPPLRPVRSPVPPLPAPPQCSRSAWDPS